MEKVSIPGGWVSEVFAEDVQKLIEEVQELSDMAEHLEDNIQKYITRRYLQEIKIKARDIIRTLRDAIKYNIFVIENPNERVVM